MRPAAAALLLVLAVCGLCGALASSAAGAAYQAKKPAPAEPAAAGEQLTEASPSMAYTPSRSEAHSNSPDSSLTYTPQLFELQAGADAGDPRVFELPASGQHSYARGVQEADRCPGRRAGRPAHRPVHGRGGDGRLGAAVRTVGTSGGQRDLHDAEPVIVAVQETLRKWGRAYTGVRERCAGEAGPARAQAPPKPAMQQAREFVERYVAAVKAYAATDQTTRLALAAIATCIVVGAAFGYQFGLREEAAPAAPPRTAPVSAPAAPAEAAGDAKKPAKGAAEAGGDVPSTPAADGDAPLESSD